MKKLIEILLFLAILFVFLIDCYFYCISDSMKNASAEPDYHTCIPYLNR
jgi:hypothetical protein